jgi:hypothetical protein
MKQQPSLIGSEKANNLATIIITRALELTGDYEEQQKRNRVDQALPQEDALEEGKGEKPNTGGNRP